MATARIRRQKGVALTAVVVAHAGLLGALAIDLQTAVERPDAEVAMTPVYLVDARRAARPPRAAPDRPRTTAVRPRIVADLPPTPAAPVAPAPLASAFGAAPVGDAERAKLAGILRASRVGCANPALLTERERLRCEGRLAAGAAAVAYIPTPLPPERRAYYDAVIKAKQPYPAAPMIPGETPPPAIRPANGLAALLAEEEVYVPLPSCKVGFGSGARGKKPNHALKLGPLPCYITPPQSPFAVEVNIVNPDEVVKGKE